MAAELLRNVVNFKRWQAVIDSSQSFKRLQWDHFYDSLTFYSKNESLTILWFLKSPLIGKIQSDFEDDEGGFGMLSVKYK